MSDWNRDAAVGVVGVGVMGGGMARNILTHGYPVAAFDVSERALAAIAEKGARPTASVREVAALARTQICMVETTAQAEAVIVGTEGLIAGTRPGDSVLCCSTIDPMAVKAMHAKLAVADVELLDVPVSGGYQRASDGDLTAIVGGDANALESVRPIIDAFASSVFHVGDVGQGMAMKLVNNMMIQVSTVALAEAFVMGAKAGLDPSVMFDVMRVSTAASTALEMRAPRFISGDFEPGGTVDISYKDQELETAFAKALGVPVLLANVSQQVYEMARASGYGPQDGASVIKVYERLVDIAVGHRDPESP